jgi:hypothetical protein
VLQDYPSFIPKESQHNISRCACPGRGESVTELVRFMNFLVHSYNCCSDRHASSHWTSIRRWISMGLPLHYLKNGWQKAVLRWCILQAGPPTLHYYCAVVLHSCILLPRVDHSANHEYHCCQLTRESSWVSNFYRTYKGFIWLSLVLTPSSVSRRTSYGLCLETPVYCLTRYKLTLIFQGWCSLHHPQFL